MSWLSNRRYVMLWGVIILLIHTCIPVAIKLNYHWSYGGDKSLHPTETMDAIIIHILILVGKGATGMYILHILHNATLPLIKDPCMVGYTYLTKTGRCYMFDHVTLMTWDEAKSSCMDDGGDLIGHETQNELHAISSWIAPGLTLK